MRAFPNAKIIVTTRNPDSWFDSWWSSIGLTLKAIETHPVKFVLSFIENPKIKFIHETARSLVPEGCSMSLDAAFQVSEILIWCLESESELTGILGLGVKNQFLE